MADRNILERVRLPAIAEGPRFHALDRLESYYRCTQYNHLRYDWDGIQDGYGDADIQPGYYVPIKRRRPSARYDLARIIVRRFTSLLFGKERWPEITVPGDPDAEDYARQLVKESRLSARMIEARNLGGAQGSVGLSFAFVDGRPRVEVHNAKHVMPLTWADRTMLRPRQVIQTYTYKRRMVEADGKVAMKDFFFARYWDDEVEILWEPIPAEAARSRYWAELPHYVVEHRFGFCPFYWLQNQPDSHSMDGEADFEGGTDNCDSINRILSASNKGTIASCEPTLVIKQDPTLNTGSVRKGSDNAIYSAGGAEYLELQGTAVQAAREQMQELKQQVLDLASAVLVDPSDMGGAAQTAAAQRMLYAPMLSQCDVYRDQYGEMGLKALLEDMLRACRQIMGTPPGEIVTTEDGRRIQLRPTVTLDPKAEEQEDGSVRYTERSPGTVERIELKWAPYFPDTWQDIERGTNATRAASGNKQLVSHKTAVRAVATMFGVHDVDTELEDIEEDAQQAVERQQELFGLGPGTPTPKLGEEELYGTKPKPGGGNEPPQEGKGAQGKE